MALAGRITDGDRDLPWQQTRERIGRREQQNKLLPSDPQWQMGRGWKAGRDEMWRGF